MCSVTSHAGNRFQRYVLVGPVMAFGKSLNHETVTRGKIGSLERNAIGPNDWSTVVSIERGQVFGEIRVVIYKLGGGKFSGRPPIKVMPSFSK